MTTTRSLFFQYLSVALLSTLGAIAFLTLPYFEDDRFFLMESFTLTPIGLTIATGVLVIAAYAIIFSRLSQIISAPVNRLLKEAETNHLNSAFSPKSKLMEISRFRFLLENRALVSAEMEEQIEELEVRISNLKEENKRALSESEERRQEAVELSKQMEELRLDRLRLKEMCERLEKELIKERSAKVGEEVEKRTSEIYSQMEKAVEASAYRTLWLPKAVQSLKMPATLVHETATRLAKNWETSSFTRLRQDVDLISQQSALQVERLSELENRMPEQEEEHDDRDSNIKSFASG